MTKETRSTLTHKEALDEFYGGVHGLAKMKLPFTCKCGARQYRKSKKEEMPIPVMTIPDCYKHIRKGHGEKISKSK